LPDVWKGNWYMSELSHWRELLKNDDDLARFMRSMQKFDHLFCDLMNKGSEYTLRLEIKGRKGRLLHCRVGTDEFDRDE